MTGAFPSLGAEIPAFRTEYSNTYATAGGQGYVARVFTRPVNYRAPGQGWQPIDDRLVRSGTGFANVADSYRAVLPDRLGSGALELSAGGSSVSMQLIGASGQSLTASSAVQVSGDQASYASVLPGVSATYQAAAGELKESFMLSSPAASSVFRFKLTLSGGLHLRVRGDTVAVLDQSGKVRFVLPAPVMSDTKPGAMPNFADLGHVAVSVTPAPGGAIMVLRPDQRWLSAPGRRWPVVLDPTIATQTANDCTIANSAFALLPAFCGIGLEDFVGDVAGINVRTMLDFSGGVSAIPADSQVLGARMYVNVATTVNSTTVPVWIFPETRRFTPLLASWNYFNTLTLSPWSSCATPPQPAADFPGEPCGGDFQSENSSGNLALASEGLVSSTGLHYFDMTALAQGWVDGSVPLQELMMLEPLYNSGNEIGFYNKLSGAGPHIDIQYAPRLGEPRGATVNSTQLTDRTSLGVNVANGNLLVQSKDLNIAGTGLDETVNRTYNNLSPFADELGHGWAGGMLAHPYIASYTSDGVVLVGPDDNPSFWDYTGSGFVPPPGLDANLCSLYVPGSCPTSGADVPIPGAVFQVVFEHTGERWEFNSAAQLMADIDKNGNTITHGFGSTGQLSLITDTQGRTVTITPSPANAALISGVSDVAGARSLGYAYNSGGQLTSYTDAAGSTTGYAYDASGNLTQITDPAGEVTKMTYDASGRVLSVTRVTNPAAGTGDTTTYGYYTPSSVPGGDPACTSPPANDGLLQYGETIQTNPNGHVTAYCYDTHDRVYETVDAYGRPSLVTYDADDNVTTATNATGATTTSKLDGCFRPSGTIQPPSATGQTPAATSEGYPSACSSPANFVPTSATDAQGNTISYSYDGNQNLTQVTDQLPAGQNTTAMAYNSKGEILSSTDPNGHTTTYAYNSAGQLTTLTPPIPLAPASYSYDADGRMISSTDGKGQTTTYQYDKDDRIIEQTNPDGSTINYTYDPDGNVLGSVDTQTGTTTDTYDLKNRLVSETDPGPSGAPPTTASYGYDGDDNLTSLTDAGGKVTYGYDANDRVTNVQEPGVSSPISLGYDPDSRLICTTDPNGVAIQNAYDPAGNILSIQAADGQGAACNPASQTGTPSGTVFSSYIYTYNQRSADTGLRQTLTVNGASPWTYSYDALNRLIEANNGQGSPLYYRYDGDGNLTSKPTLANGKLTVTPYSYNAADEISTTGYSYDANGNLLARADTGGTTNLGYNPRNQTTSISPDGAGAQTLSYRGTGQKDPTQIGTAPSGGTPPSLTENTLGISSQTTAGGGGQTAATTYYTRTADGALLSQRAPNGSYYYVQDANRSVVALTNNTGAIANTYAYDPYGATSSSTGTTPNNFGFDSGLEIPGGLYLFGERYYDPIAGSWTQPDPLTQANPFAHLADPAQIDNYAFAGDNPVNSTDPNGTNQAGAELGAVHQRVQACRALQFAHNRTKTNPYYGNRSVYSTCQYWYHVWNGDYAGGGGPQPAWCVAASVLFGLTGGIETPVVAGAIAVLGQAATLKCL